MRVFDGNEQFHAPMFAIPRGTTCSEDVQCSCLSRDVETRSWSFPTYGRDLIHWLWRTGSEARYISQARGAGNEDDGGVVGA